MSKKKTQITRVIVPGVAAAALAVVVVNANWGQKTEEVTTSAYRTETVQRGTITSGITESGTVSFGTEEQEFSVSEVVEVSSSSDSDSASTATASAAGSGAAFTAMNQAGGGSANASSQSSSSGDTTSLTVEVVYVASGQTVSEGDKILKITDDSIASYREELTAAVKSAQLQVKQEEVNVESKKAEAEYNHEMYLAEGETAEETYEATIASLDKAVSDLEEELEDAKETLDTYQSYVDSGYSYEEELEEAQEEYDSVASELQLAKNNRTTKTIEAEQTKENALTNYKYADQLYEIDTDGLEDDLDDAKETLEEAETALAEFEEQIGNGIVYAAYSGTVTEIAYAAGDAIVNDEALVTYSDAEDVTIAVSVSQDDISKVSVGMSAEIALTAYPDETFTGMVSGISTSATTGSSTVSYEVTVKFDGDTGKVYSGMTGEVTFAEKTMEDTLYISNRAVQLDGTTSYVNVQDEDGTVRKVEITTGYSNGSVVAVEDGLEEGETVLLESQVGA
ncbi:MAG: efflux RND transporter periplasmic adaptor subunit [Lachnospiraceae bacterium]|nr:efflux RND transporter periplasmic adaptor subunit [Lachnospiraceae bacterium]